MSTAEAANAIQLHAPYVHVEASGRGRELPSDRWTPCFRCGVEAG